MWQHLTVTEIACKLVFWNSKMLFTSSHPEITLSPNLTKSPSNPTPSNPNPTYSNSTATQLVHCTKLFHLWCHIFSFPLLEHRLSHKFPQTISTDKLLDQYFSRIGFYICREQHLDLSEVWKSVQHVDIGRQMVIVAFFLACHAWPWSLHWWYVVGFQSDVRLSETYG